ncbi:3-oxoacyl-ACP synthase III [Candidatus Sumerlaeota bacterium]|nr:3-oxoacyl-ACP synthase III [Candidatus Sumerlaeota bacterium]
MKYSKVYIESFGYELPPVVVTTEELEERLKPLYDKLHLPPGQIEAMTGIVERRWWEPNFRLSAGAIAAAQQALDTAGISGAELGALIYGGVNREHLEPATACAVADGIGVSPDAAVYDICNACLGAVNAMLDIANRIELGQIRAGLVVSCETAREINDIMIEQMLENGSVEFFTRGLATLTGGSAAVAVLLTDGSFPKSAKRRRILGGVNCTAPEHNELCLWGFAPTHKTTLFRQFTSTDSSAVLKHGVALGVRTWRRLTEELGWSADMVDRTICHQVGSAHQQTILNSLGIDPEKDFPTFPFLGNTGTVALPVTAAIADERGELEPGAKAALLGIGSGLNCVMLGCEW